MAEVVWIDTRERHEYLQLSAAGAFHMPIQALAKFSCALPPRSTAIRVIVDPHGEDGSNRAAAVRQLEMLAFTDWHVTTLEEAASSTHLAPGSPDGRRHCWSPCELVLRCIEGIEAKVKGPGVLLDVGCGVGRDMIYCALRGWHCIGLDNRHPLLKKAALFGALHETHIDPVRFELRRDTKLILREGLVDLLLVSRFLHRPSLDALWRQVRVGGFVVYSHFLDGCQHTAVGTPSTIEGYFLDGELESLLSKTGLFQLMSSERTVLPDGRPLTNVIAERMR